MSERSGRGPVMLLLVDPATSGTAGAYIDGIYRHLDHPERVEVAVSHYFPFDYGLRIFYKYSELHAQRRYRLGRLRMYVRGVELVWALARLFLFVRRRRVRAVCYAISSTLRLEYLFLVAVKRLTGAEVLLVCHDVIPFTGPGDDLESMIRKRSRFYQLADRLVVHNQNSMDDLREVFGVRADRVECFPFPPFDFSRMGIEEVRPPSGVAAYRFLFLGHLRHEKGLDLLLEAWDEFRPTRAGVELIVAGNVPKGADLDLSRADERGIRVMPGYLSDAQYLGLIREADCVVLPYRRGTNSGIVSSVLAYRRDLIVSDIGMFANHPLIPKQSFFRSGDRRSLCARLAHFADRAADPGLLEGEEAEARFEAYALDFRRRLNSVFAQLIEPQPG